MKFNLSIPKISYQLLLQQLLLRLNNKPNLEKAIDINQNVNSLPPNRAVLNDPSFQFSYSRIERGLVAMTAYLK